MKDAEILITRHFEHPRERVWCAWTDPEHLVRWHAPDGCRIEYPTLDLREGGRFHSCIRTPDGADCWCVGEYREIVPSERLVYTIALADERGERLSADTMGGSPGGKDPEWPIETTVTVTLVPENGGTRLTLHQTAPEAVARRTGAYGSWLQMLDRLEGRLQPPNP